MLVILMELNVLNVQLAPSLIKVEINCVIFVRTNLQAVGYASQEPTVLVVLVVSTWMIVIL